MIILGISAFYHDSAVALVEDGEIIFAAQEERYTRKKHDQSFPHNSIKAALKFQNISIDDVDFIAFYDKPFLKFERILESYLSNTPLGLNTFFEAIPTWLKQKLWIKQTIKKKLAYQGEILFPEHHLSHAASAFFPSPYKKAAFITIDGVGEYTTTSFGIGTDNNLEILADLHFPDSLGLLYSAFTAYLGFKVNSGEYKIMGLAPYGEPKYTQLILDNLIDLKEDGSFKLNQDFFTYQVGQKMTNQKFHNLFGAPPRESESNLTQREMDIARSLQEVTEICVLKMAKHVKKITKQDYLCLAGGVALNCVANGKILKEKIFKDIWIQPAAGDAGGALGAALGVWYQYLNNPRVANNKNDFQKGSYLGPEFSNQEIKRYLDKNRVVYEYYEFNDLAKKCATLISQENVLGWFQGRMEFGPRALGSRSIVGDPRSKNMQKVMNLKIKFRESFRPFAPSVLEEYVSDIFEIDRPSPYMLLVADVRKKHLKKIDKKDLNKIGLDKLNIIRSNIPAITHVDNSARMQSVNSKTNPRYHHLISQFNKKSNCPLVINTSFNVRGEPIVCTPEDAFRCFMNTNMDYLAIGNYLISKNDQPAAITNKNWKQKFKLD